MGARAEGKTGLSSPYEVLPSVVLYREGLRAVAVGLVLLIAALVFVLLVAATAGGATWASLGLAAPAFLWAGSVYAGLLVRRRRLGG